MIRTHNLSVGTAEVLYELIEIIINPHAVGRDSIVYFILSNFLMNTLQRTISSTLT